MNKFLSIASLAALGLTLFSTDAEACFRRKKSSSCCGSAMPVATSSCGGCGGTTYGTVGGPVYYGSGTYSTTPGAVAGGPAVAMPMATTPSPMPGVATAANKPGTVTVLVPSAEAQVWFEDTALPQTGKERTFNTPPLADGKSYNYNVKAKWTNDAGKAVEKTLPVSVRAGQTSTVDFR
jgi:uncharacterized protein (TIGR03000 family)